MAIVVPATRAALAEAYGDLALFASLHSADPGETGTGEIAIARQALTWGPGVEDGEILSDYVTFPVAAPVIATHVGIWSASTAGTFIDSLEIDAELPAGDYTVSLAYVQI